MTTILNNKEVEHSPRWLHLTNSIYQEIVVDGPASADAESMLFVCMLCVCCFYMI